MFGGGGSNALGDDSEGSVSALSSVLSVVNCYCVIFLVEGNTFTACYCSSSKYSVPLIVRDPLPNDGK